MNIAVTFTDFVGFYARFKEESLSIKNPIAVGFGYVPLGLGLSAIDVPGALTVVFIEGLADSGDGPVGANMVVAGGLGVKLSEFLGEGDDEVFG